MTRVQKGSAVPRSQVFVLADGNPVVQWTEDRVQELLTGTFRAFDYGQFGHAILDNELDQLRAGGAVELYTRQYVWLTAMPEEQHLFWNTAAEADPETIVYLIHTLLPASALPAAREVIDLAGLQSQIEPGMLHGQIVFAGRGGHPFRSLDEAEAAEGVIRALDPHLQDAIVILVAGRDARRATSQIVTAALEDDSPVLSFDELAASQSASPVTMGRSTALIGDAGSAARVLPALERLGLRVFWADSFATAETTLDVPPELAIVHGTDAQQLAGDLLARLEPEGAWQSVAFILMAGPEELEPELALRLRDRGVRLLVSGDDNDARLRLRIFELFQTLE